MGDTGHTSAADVEMKEQEGQKAEEQSEGEKSTSESEKTESASENAEVKKDKGEEEKTEAAKDEGPPERPYENPMLVHLLTQCRLIERILEAWEEDDLDRAQLPASRGRGSRRGYMGHLTKVTN